MADLLGRARTGSDPYKRPRLDEPPSSHLGSLVQKVLKPTPNTAILKLKPSPVSTSTEASIKEIELSMGTSHKYDQYEGSFE